MSGEARQGSLASRCVGVVPATLVWAAWTAVWLVPAGYRTWVMRSSQAPSAGVIVWMVVQWVIQAAFLVAGVVAVMATWQNVARFRDGLIAAGAVGGVLAIGVLAGRLMGIE